jgi:ABC-type nickel/cobalt efflux system permease component RcnA
MNRMCVKSLLSDIGRIIIFDKWMITYFKPKSKVMKTLNLIGWVSGGIGVLIILLGFISGIIGKSILPIQHIGTYFQIANSFLLITIALFIVVNRCECNKKQ